MATKRQGTAAKRSDRRESGGNGAAPAGATRPRDALTRERKLERMDWMQEVFPARDEQPAEKKKG